VELEKHCDNILNAFFYGDEDNFIVSVSVDKHIVITEVMQETFTDPIQGTGYRWKAVTLKKIETKNFSASCLSRNVFVTTDGQNQL
jgi:hypothetical protein